MEIIVLARRDRKRSGTPHTVPSQDISVEQFGTSERIDITGFFLPVPYSRFVTYEKSKMTVRRWIPIDRRNR
ncbi:hypothetical protein JQ543_20650 [Bradyrhizobium diazoefficiens]|nr:hypothetical protein [Bradyrhizobium diazoefficiens]MBR0850172.1 hypothetical protein [Bradyrhizobium diazoefficiens]